MKIFKRTDVSSKRHEFAVQLGEKLIQVQRHLAELLNTKFGQQSRSNQKLSLIAFTVIFGGYCVYLLINAIQ